MSFAQHNLDLEVANVICAPAAMPQVWVVVQTPAIAKDMQAEIARDSDLNSRVFSGTLSQFTAQGSEVWALASCIAFEVSDHQADDLRALAEIHSTSHDKVQCIALSGKVLPDREQTVLKAAGVQEVLTLGHGGDAKTNPSQSGGGDVTAILRARGGAGASTLAVNLAVGQAQKGTPGRTALIDLDIQNGAVGVMLEMPESSHASDWVTGTSTANAGFIEQAMQRHESGLDVFSAPDIFAPITALTAQKVTDLISALRARYDHIVLDMPQGVADWIEPVLTHAARVVLVSDTGLPSVKRTRRLIDLIREEHMTLPVEVVINQHRKPVVLSATHREIEALWGRPLQHWIPQDTRSARRATDLGQPLVTCARRSPAARAIGALGTALLTPTKKV